MYAAPVQELIDELGRLPGIGPKSAQRIAFHLLRVDPVDARRLAAAIVDAKERVTWCRRCFNISEGELCAFCRDERRDTRSLCVVEEPRDIVAIERTGEFKGRYHVLQGAISPIEGIGPEQLRQVFNDTDAEVLWLIVGLPEELEFLPGAKTKPDMSLIYPVDPKQLPKELAGVEWPPTA